MQEGAIDPQEPLRISGPAPAVQRLLSLALNCRIGAVGKEQAVVAAESGRSNVGGKRTGAARRDRSA